MNNKTKHVMTHMNVALTEMPMQMTTTFTTEKSSAL
jgi:hypothetical protein